MKKNIGAFLFCFLLIAFFSSCSWFSSDGDDDVTVPQEEQKDENTSDMGAVHKVSESVYFKDGKKNSDWLIVSYCDADNSLDYPVQGYPCFEDLNEAEYGLSGIRNSDGTTRDGFDSVRFVVLWDGVALSSLAGGSTDHSRSRVFELGQDAVSLTSLGQNTVEITGIDFIDACNGELDMSDYKTLSKFLVWAERHYSATKIILQVANHGGGPGGDSLYLAKDSRGNVTASICNDETSAIKNATMSSREFATALKDAGYGNGKKLEMLIFDLCLGAGFEDAYEFRNLARYMVASPNSTPAKGMPYHLLLPLFSKNISTVSLGKGIVNKYRDFYAGAIWPSIASSLSYFTSGLSERDRAEYYSWFGFSPAIPTLTFMDLSKASDCADKIDALALQIKNKANLYRPYLFRESTPGINFYCPIDRMLFYDGNMSWLFDIGYFAYVVSQRDQNATQDVYAAREVMTALSGMIIHSYRDSLFCGGIPQPASSVFTSDSGRKVLCDSLYSYLGLDCLGISICGGSKVRFGISGYTSGGIPSHYLTQLEFGKRSNGWADMLKDSSWFGTAR